jgi:hypothetical protein
MLPEVMNSLHLLQWFLSRSVNGTRKKQDRDTLAIEQRRTRIEKKEAGSTGQRRNTTDSEVSNPDIETIYNS